MAAKTFQCVICKAEVSKPQSYAYKDGRACRHHPEVQENHVASEEAKKADLEQSKHRAEHPSWNFSRTQSAMTSDEMFAAMGTKDPNKHCWCCHKDGVYEHIILERYLINMSKVELRSNEPVPAFDVKDGMFGPNEQVRTAVQNELGKDIEPLRRIVVKQDFPDWKLKQVINPKNHQDKIQLVRMTEIIVLCKNCAKKYEFSWEYFSEQSKLPDLKGMFMVGQLIKPVFDSVAAGEIARDEISDIMKK